jgi:hypothetical protein
MCLIHSQNSMLSSNYIVLNPNMEISRYICKYGTHILKMILSSIFGLLHVNVTMCVDSLKEASCMSFVFQRYRTYSNGIQNSCPQKAQSGPISFLWVPSVTIPTVYEIKLKWFPKRFKSGSPHDINVILSGSSAFISKLFLLRMFNRHPSSSLLHC